MAGKTRWRRVTTPDGVVTLTDPSGRVVIEKHTHHYGPWLIKDTLLDERVDETEVSEAEAKRLAEEYLTSPRPVPPAPVEETPRERFLRRVDEQGIKPRLFGQAVATFEEQYVALAGDHYRKAVLGTAAALRRLADDVERHAEPRPNLVGGQSATPYGETAAAVVSTVTNGLNGLSLAGLVRCAAEADVAVEKLRAARGQ